MALPRFLVRNAGSKLLALAIALALWFSLSGERRERTSERTYHVPLSIVNIPAHSLVASAMPPSVDVRLRAPFTAFRQLEPDRLEAVLDLKEAAPGDRVYRLTPDDVNVPPEVEVISISPQEIPFRLDTLEEKTLPVVPAVVGEPAPGLRVAGVRSEPPTVRLTGPATVLARMTEVATVPVSVAGRTATFTIPAAIAVSDPTLRLRQAPGVAVTVRLEPVAPAEAPTPGKVGG
ncbi:MAG TPA: CdaR family protein [Thermoanaerobaculia bacterium]|nr:CdaR family protein [Thermoanaerobaculia bacterium]